jgi:tetratricopeptide (TPR) repeat protein
MTPSVDILIHQAQLAEREGRRDDARSLFERALYSLRRIEDGSMASTLLRWVARTYQADADIDAAMDCLDAAIAVGELAGDAGAVGHAINVQAIVHQQRGDLDTAESLYLSARARAIEASETRLAAMTALNLGVIAMVRGDHDKTLRYYRTSLAEFRTLGAPKEIVMALNNMAMLCTDLERWDDAVRAFDEAVQIAEALGDIPARILLEVIFSPRVAHASWPGRSRRRRRTTSRWARSKSISAPSRASSASWRRPRNISSARSASRWSERICCSRPRRRASMRSFVASRDGIATR